MKHFAVSFLSLFFSLATLAQSTQPCLVMQYNQKEKKTPLPGVEVIVSNAGSSVSNQAGRLTLSFRTLKPGDKVNLISAKKIGYEVFNLEAVQQWFVSRDQSPFTLVLVKKEYFEQLKAALTQTSTDSYKRKYEQAVRELEKQKKDGVLKEKEFNRKYDELEIQYQTRLSSLDNYIDQFARIDLSEISDEEQRILNLVHNGNIEVVLEAYENLGLISKLNSEAATYQVLNVSVKAIQEEIGQRKSNIDALYESIQRQLSAFHLADKKKESEDLLLSLLETIAPLYEKEPEYYRAKYAKTLLQLGELSSSDSRSLEYLSKAVEEYEILFSKNPDIFLPEFSYANYQLGCFYRARLDDVNAEKYLLSADKHYTTLYQHDPDKYAHQLAWIKSLLGELFTLNNRTHEAVAFYLETLEILEPFIEKKPSVLNLYSETLLHLGNLYDKTQSFVKAEDSYLKGLTYIKQSALDDFEQQGELVRIIQRQIGEFYTKTLHDATKAGVFFQEEDLFYMNLINSLSGLFKNDPEKYGHILATVLDNYYSYLVSVATFHDNAQIGSCFRTFFDNYTMLYDYKPGVFGSKLAEKQRETGTYYRKERNDTITAEKFFLMELDTYRHLYQIDPMPYGIALSETLAHLGLFFKNNKDTLNAESFYHKAEESYTKALNLLTYHYQHDNLAFGEELAKAQHSMGSFYLHSMSDSLKAEKCFLEEIDTYTQLSKSDPRQYRGDLAEKLKSMGDFYNHEDGVGFAFIFHKSLNEMSKERAEEFYLKAEKEFKQLSLFDLNRYGWRYGYILANLQEYIGDFYKNRKEDFDKAEEYFLNAEQTLIHLSSFDYISYAPFLANMQDRLARFYHYTIADRAREESALLNELATYSKLMEVISNHNNRGFLAVLLDSIRLFYANDNSRLEQYDDMLEAELENYEILYNESDSNYNKKMVTDLRILKGWRSLQQDKIDDAMDLFLSAYQLDPEESVSFLATCYNQKAYELARARDFTMAIKTIEKAIALMPDDANYYDSKGEILLMQGDEKGALEMWKKVLELEPDFLEKWKETELHLGLKERKLTDD